MKLRLDTDLGGDIDDLCALAMLLRWPGVELMDVTTCAEEGGRRAGYVRRVLALEGRGEIPVAAGAEAPHAPRRHHQLPARLARLCPRARLGRGRRDRGRPLKPETDGGGVLRLTPHPDGAPTRVVTRVDGDAFSRFWLDTVAGG